MSYSADEMAIFRELFERSKVISKEERKHILRQYGRNITNLIEFSGNICYIRNAKPN